MKTLDATYWENRYQKKETGWDLKSISPPLQQIIDHLAHTQPTQKDLKILIPGAGMGYEVLYLFEKGYTNVYVVDLAPSPLESIAQACPNFPKNQLICGDFFDVELSDFDLVLEQTFFCALHPELREAYAQKMHGILKKGGTLQGLLFQFPLTDQGPPFGGSLEEYLDLFEPYFKILFIETAQNSIKPRANKELFFIFENK
ncbi:TPMT family class I SAM-dependent methyltransferase [Flavobacteriaceae bacterium LSUCC0859]|nr:TPMT family class I SAM-dependent methyltransferase [Flavobacteriaceae bacterium LSUCC0859]